MRRFLLDALFQRYTGLGCRVRHGAAEMGDQGIEAAVETLADGHEAPLAILPVEIAQHDGALLREVAAGEGQACLVAGAVAERELAAGQLRQGPRAVHAGGNDNLVDCRRQGIGIDLEADRVALLGKELDPAARCFWLVEKGHVTLVLQLAILADAKAGEVQRQAVGGKADGDAAVGSDASDWHTLPF